MTTFEYRVLFRVEGTLAWTQYGEVVTGSAPGGRRVADGLTNGQAYEFMVVRDAPSFRESDIIVSRPLADIDAPPNTFVPEGEQVVGPDGTGTGQRGLYNDGQNVLEGVLVNFSTGANWNSFDVVVTDAEGNDRLLCTVVKSPKAVRIDGTSFSIGAQSLVIELVSNKQYFIVTGGGADVSVRPNGGSFAAFTLEIT